MVASTTESDVLLSSAQGAKILGISSNAFCRLCDSGEITHFRIGAGEKKRYKARESDVRAYLLSCQVQPRCEVPTPAVKPKRAKQDECEGFTLLRSFGYRG